jgi:hypothetical protein
MAHARKAERNACGEKGLESGQEGSAWLHNLHKQQNFSCFVTQIEYQTRENPLEAA